MLEKVGFKNFLALRDVELTLEPLTVIVGPNASGKSSILEGIRRMLQVKTSITEFLRSGDDFLDGEENNSLSTLLSRNSESEFLSISFTRHGLQSSKFQLDTKNGSFNYFVDDNQKLTKNSASGYFVKDVVIPSLPIKYLEFSYREVARPSYTRNPEPYLEKTGKGLATILSNMKLLDDEKFLKIEKHLASIIMNLVKIKIQRKPVPPAYWFNMPPQKPMQIPERSTTNSETGEELLFDFVNAPDVPANRVSEGTLFALTVLVMAASSENDTVILIDDIERGLHPKAVKDLIRVLREIQAITPNLQIIATSHSPYVLHELEPKEVRVTTFDPELGTLVAPLEAYPNFEEWRDSMTPGEFWSFVGEDWVKDVSLEKSRA